MVSRGGLWAIVWPSWTRQELDGSWTGGSDCNTRIIRSLQVACNVAGSVRGWRDGPECYSRADHSSTRLVSRVLACPQPRALVSSAASDNQSCTVRTPGGSAQLVPEEWNSRFDPRQFELPDVRAKRE